MNIFNSFTLIIPFNQKTSIVSIEMSFCCDLKLKITTLETTGGKFLPGYDKVACTNVLVLPPSNRKYYLQQLRF